MSERFNSGQGGYTCDQCNVLMWAGLSGDEKIYCYSLTEKDIVEIEGKFFCCSKCAEEYLRSLNVSIPT
jgi:hypothetical protein